MNVPYASATSDMRAREEIRKILTCFGCESIGFMDDNTRHETLLAFEHRNQQIQMRVSAKGWATMWLKENPYNGRRRMTRHEYEQAALQRAVLRAWAFGSAPFLKRLADTTERPVAPRPRGRPRRREA